MTICMTTNMYNIILMIDKNKKLNIAEINWQIEKKELLSKCAFIF